MVTAGRVTNAFGAVVYFPYFQIIWKGKSSRCHPHFNDKTKVSMHPCIHRDHAVKKTHTHETFMQFCKDFDWGLLEVKKQASLPLDMPSVLLVDNVSRHLNYDALVKIESPTRFNIHRVQGTHFYLLLGLPNGFHMLNSTK